MKAERVLFVGRATLDVLYRLDQFPAEDTKVFANDMRAMPGGPAMNAAITHALLGGGSVLVTAVGEGPWAGPVRAELDRLGIVLIDLADGTRYETPLTTVLVNSGGATRTIVNPPFSDVELKAVKEWEPGWGDMPGVVLVDGFHLRETLGLVAACHNAGARVCLDGGSWKPGTAELAALLDVAICSERFRVPGRGADAESTIAWFAEQGVTHLAITRGARPILGWERGRRFAIEIAPIDAVDTLGAGDVLHGAFCFEFARSGDFESALRSAAKVATRSCEGLGIQCWMAGERWNGI